MLDRQSLSASGKSKMIPPLFQAQKSKVKSFWGSQPDFRKESFLTVFDEIASKYMFDAFSSLARSGFITIDSESNQSSANRSRQPTSNLVVHEIRVTPIDGLPEINQKKFDALAELLSAICFVSRRGTNSHVSSSLTSMLTANRKAGAKTTMPTNSAVELSAFMSPDTLNGQWNFLLKVKPKFLSKFFELITKVNALAFCGPKILPTRTQLGSYVMDFVQSLQQHPTYLLMVSPIEPLARGVASLFEFQILAAHQQVIKSQIIHPNPRAIHKILPEDEKLYPQNLIPKSREDLSEMEKFNSTRTPSDVGHLLAGGNTHVMSPTAPAIHKTIDEEIVLYFNDGNLKPNLRPPPGLNLGHSPSHNNLNISAHSENLSDSDELISNSTNRERDSGHIRDVLHHAATPRGSTKSNGGNFSKKNEQNINQLLEDCRNESYHEDNESLNSENESRFLDELAWEFRTKLRGL